VKNVKLFISCDIEGTCGIGNFEETSKDRDNSWYDHFRKQMTREVAAACEGAIEAGVSEIVVKDSHNTGRNIIHAELPKIVKLTRGWPNDMFSMVGGLQYGFNAVGFTGYHGAATAGGNPMSHTMNLTIAEARINGILMSEFVIQYFAAGMLGVPIVFISGDEDICAQASELVPGITAIPVMKGRGASVTSIHPDIAVEAIQQGVKTALSGDLEKCRVVLPNDFSLAITYTTHMKANAMSHYPGAGLLDTMTIGFKTNDYMEVLRCLSFVL